jgi:CDP-diacylglycerol--glycerol-3-phosphate 3-phosphatidyltransferase
MIAHCLTFSRLWLAAAFCTCVGVYAPGGKVTLGVAALLVALGILEELTDLFDGIAARHYGQTSELGGLFDPLADSLARLAIYFALALVGWVTIAVPLVMTTRDIVVAYTRIIQARVGGHTSARLAGKIKAAIQGAAFPTLVAVAWLEGAWRADVAHACRLVLSVVLVVGTAWSAWSYVHGSWPAIKSLAQPQAPQKSPPQAPL